MNVQLNVYIFTLRKMSVNKMYIPGTIANSQRTPTKINKNGGIAKVRVLVEQDIL